MIPIYWINLDESLDRRNTMIDTFLSQSMIHRRIPAIKHEKPIIGCCFSHIKAIHTAWLEGNEMAIICEDDADFSNATSIYQHISIMLSSLPSSIQSEWDIIQLQYTEPHFSHALLEYVMLRADYEDVSNLRNRMVKGYLYGAVCYLINRKGMESFLRRMVVIDPEDRSKYIVTASFDHPRAGSEELIFRYVQTYFSVFPIINYVSNVSTINPFDHYKENNENNRNYIEKIKLLLHNSQYECTSNQAIYELEYDMHWINEGDMKASEIIYSIFHEY
jgi:GR25 family glycosyltransferase involved in LPS biosynthesis